MSSPDRLPEALARELRSLSPLLPDAASPRFTERVLDRADRSAGPTPRRLPSSRLVAAAAVLIAGIVVLALLVPALHQRQERQARLRLLEAERQSLAAELEEIRRLASEPLPMIYVGGDDRVDLVVDPESLSRDQRRMGAARRVRPISNPH